jgi:glutathione peroxidase
MNVPVLKSGKGGQALRGKEMFRNTALKLAGMAVLLTATTAAAACPEYLNHDLRKLHSREVVNLCEVSGGKPLLIVNTASHCGYTPQFKGLEQVYEKYRERGLQVVGFASDDFRQEAKDEEKAAEVCYVNYGVTFTMIAPSHVRGVDPNPVFRELAKATQAPSWNFNKYLVDRSGKVVAHFGSNTSPDSPQLQQAIEQLL